MTTYFVVMSWLPGRSGMLISEEPWEARSAEHCRRMVARLVAEGRAGAVGFSRTGDPSTGDWEDAVVIHRAGELPDDEDVFAMAS